MYHCDISTFEITLQAIDERLVFGIMGERNDVFIYSLDLGESLEKRKREKRGDYPDADQCSFLMSPSKQT